MQLGRSNLAIYLFIVHFTVGVVVIPAGAALCKDVNGKTRVMVGGGCSSAGLVHGKACGHSDQPDDECSSLCTDSPLLVDAYHFQQTRGDAPCHLLSYAHPADVNLLADKAPTPCLPPRRAHALSPPLDDHVVLIV